MDVLPAAIRLITQELRPWAGPKKQAVYDEIARVLSQAQRQIERRYKNRGALPAMNMGITPPTDAESLREWGARLRTRREAGGLTRDQLARLAGVADSTIRNLETGRHRPTRQILMRLQSVPDLGIPSPVADPSAALATSPGEEEGIGSFACNCWFAPEYDSIQMAQDMVQSLNGRGGHVEQTHLYIDPASAAAWCAVTAQEAWQGGPGYVAMTECVRYVKELVDGSGLDIISLGPGEARDEVRLVQTLSQEGLSHIRLFLLDISQPLLSNGYRHAAQVLGDLGGVAVYAIQGNFHNLQRYTALLHTPERAHRRRIVCLFGNTFANLQNEILFVRNSLMGFAPGDFLLFSVGETMAPADKPEEILSKDRLLAGKTAETMSTGRSLQDRMFCDLLRRYIHGLKSTEIKSVLDFAACPIPGSYAADIRATVKMTSGESKHFSIAYLKRYERRLLDETMIREGWQPVAHWRSAKDYHPRLLLLYQRTH